MSEHSNLDELRQNVRELERIFNLSLDMIGTGNLEGYFTKINSSFTQILGYSEEEFCEHPFLNFVHEGDIEKTKEALGSALTGKETIHLENRYKSKDGSYKWIEWRVHSILHENKFIAVGRDITERKKTEQALLESETRYRNVVENAGELIWQVDSDGKFIFFNKYAEKISGHKSSDWQGKYYAPFVHPDDLSHVEKVHDDVMAGNAIDYQTRIFNIKGEIVDLDVLAIPLNVEGEVTGSLNFGRDITQRKSAEKALRESQAKMSAMMASLSDHVTMIDRDLNITWANGIARELFGEDLVGKKCHQVFHRRKEPCIPYPCIALKAFQDDRSCTHETQIVDKDGQTRYFHCTANVAIRDENGNPTSVMEVSRDITDQKLAAQALEESEKKHRALIENLSEMILILDKDGINRWNSPAVRQYGLEPEDAIGIDAREYVHPDDRDRADKALNDSVKHPGKVVTLNDLKVDPGDGTDVYLDDTFVYLPDTPGINGIVATCRDVTERRRSEKEKLELQARLLRAQKMESIGTLAGGVAHDLNNVLSGIVGYPDLLLLHLPKDSPLRKPILALKETGKKAAAIVEDLLTLARRGVNTSDVLNLNTIISQYLESPEYEYLKSSYPDIEVENSLDENLLNTFGSPVHLSKIIMNLVSNAIEAIGEVGKISISTKNRYIDRSISGYQDVVKGDYVVLTISDTGIGISSEDLERIFEPFYTKKKMGKSGTGLGMAVVWGTVKDHKGYIDVQSTNGEGTTFTLLFPATKQKPAEDRKGSAIEKYMGHGQSVLIVDDIKGQRELVSTMLKALGYHVNAVSSGEEAVEYLENNAVDLLVLDMIMEPGMDGLETYREILKIHPMQKAIIASGYSETDRVKETQILGAGHYIRKPYTLEKLGMAVKNELKNRL